MPRLVDYHIHTDFSVDAQGTPAEFGRTAVEAGLDEICFTDHVDFLEYDASYGFFRPEEYLDEVSRTKAGLRDSLTVRVGIELGIEPEAIGRAQETAANPYFQELDFVIGSVHGGDGRLLGGGYFEGKSPRQACERYLRDLESSVRLLCSTRTVDVIGHLDVLKRYAPWQRGWLDDQLDLYEQVISTLVDCGIGLEVNTSGFRQATQEQYPCVHILNIYRRLGGELLTIGSDSHSPGVLAQSGRLCRSALEVIGAAGFRYFTTFSKRKPIFHRVDA